MIYDERYESIYDNPYSDSYDGMRDGHQVVLGPVGSVAPMMFGVSWIGGAEADLCALGFDRYGRVLDDDWFIFWNNQVTRGQEVFLRQQSQPSPLQDTAQVMINLAELPSWVAGLTIILTSAPGKIMSQIYPVKTRLVDLSTGLERVRFTRNVRPYNLECVRLAELHLREQGHYGAPFPLPQLRETRGECEWVFRALDRSAGNLRETLDFFGVQVRD